MANLSVLVSLGPANAPVLTVSPAVLPVSTGNNVITWSVDPASPIQNFVFNALNFGINTPPCFANLRIGNTQITIDDTNTIGANPYEYYVSVLYENRLFATPPVASGGGAADPRAAGRGSPSIHNN
ncbi:hypothetical protein ISN76_16635 [Dyella halodurans]|uniref:Fibronectin type III domain-containing protein n=1 Tax=Dyella halodurans TaxID=1920171 RepID=A0ABV9C757_9GAMM|nr:hypothetical protein [Dyella halodurans]